MLDRSDEAPHTWQQHDTEAAVREAVLATAPDVVCFQELPAMVPFIETHGMVPVNPQSHSGHLAVLVKHELLEPAPAYRSVGGFAILVTFAEPALTIANVHLAPGRQGTGERLEQLAQVVEASPTPSLLIAGDTNTRVEETAALAEAGLVGARPPVATWNSRRNRFRNDAPEFTAYFTRWFATTDLVVDEVGVGADPIGSDGARFHLSDHHRLWGRVAPAPDPTATSTEP